MIVFGQTRDLLEDSRREETEKTSTSCAQRRQHVTGAVFTRTKTCVAYALSTVTSLCILSFLLNEIFFKTHVACTDELCMAIRCNHTLPTLTIEENLKRRSFTVLTLCLYVARRFTISTCSEQDGYPLSTRL